MANSVTTKTLKLIDIGANLADSMYLGIYNGNKKHEPDMQCVLERSWNAGLEKIIITGTSLSESEKSIDIARLDDRLYCSVGCHPTNCNEISMLENPDYYLFSMRNLIDKNRTKVVAIGEFGLDYDRLQFCDKDVQKRFFEKQLDFFSSLHLPLFLHCRNAAEDLLKILQKYRGAWSSGVVHSFDGTLDQANAFLNLGLYIGINGCSLKTNENLEVVKNIRNDRLLLETDSPWCEVRATHPGFKHIQSKNLSVKKEKWLPNAMVKGRNEPANIRQVLEIVAAVKGVELHELADVILNNTNKLFFLNT